VKKIIINKFGGGILKKELIPFMEKRLKEEIKTGYLPVVVVSALPGVTDKLLNEAKGESMQIKDKIISNGEKESAKMFAEYLNNLGMKAEVFEAEDILVTDDNFGNANIIYNLSEKNAQKKLSSLEKIPVIPGFIGKTKNGDTTTLGRGGTDTTACFVGAALRASKVVLWKDVDGVMSANPKIVKTAKTVPFVSYQEAEEAGKIIHDKAIQYVKMHDTPIEIASLVDPKQKTVVGKAKKLKHGTKIVSYKKDLVLFTIIDESKKENDLLAISVNAFFKHKLDIILINNTQYSIQIVADPSTRNDIVEEIKNELNRKVNHVTTDTVSMVYMIGSFDVEDVNDFNTLLVKSKADLEISAFLYKNCTRLEAIVKNQDLDKIINQVHNKFIK
jgi:aspartate kinase